MPCCLKTQALTPPVVKPDPVYCQPRGVLIRQIGKQRLSFRALQLCVTLGIIKDREIISLCEPLQSLLVLLALWQMNFPLKRVRLLEGANLIILDLKATDEDGKVFRNKGPSDHEGLVSESKPLILAQRVSVGMSCSQALRTLRMFIIVNI